MAYIAKTDVAKYLNITLGTSGEQIVDSLIPAAEKAVDNYCGRTWSTASNSTDITERYDGGQTIYYVKNPPIYSVQSIKTSKSSTYAGDLLDAAQDDYYIYDDRIVLNSQAPSGPRSVEIIYRTSAITPPADVKQAVIQWVAHLFKSAMDAGKTAEEVSVGAMRLKYHAAKDDIPEFVRTALMPYKHFNL